MMLHLPRCRFVCHGNAKTWIIILFYTRILILNLIAASVLNPENSHTNCISVLEPLGIQPEDIPRKPVNDVTLRYCDISSVESCCTLNIETKLAMASKLQFEKSIKESIGKLHSVLSTRAQKFNEFFSQLLVESKKEFHTMFKRTYGVIYEQNAYVFSDFFGELETYFSRGKIDLTETMDSFFNTLYQKLFTVLNSQYAFDDKYLGCISEHMKELKPFGDVPEKLSVQIKRSFVATRTYALALSTAADIAKNLMNVRPSIECFSTFAKMYLCGFCRGSAVKPCANFCVSVVKECLQYYYDLDDDWDSFLLSMERVAERLLGPFNIVMVVEPINIKISEAIMNFQETGQEITKQVFQGCGRPLLGLQKRFAQQLKISFNNNSEDYDNQQQGYEKEGHIVRRTTRNASDSLYKGYHEHSDSNIKLNSNQKRKNGRKNTQTKSENTDISKEPILDKLIKDIRQKVKDSKKFWSNLPYQVCNNEDLAFSSRIDNLCWNGNLTSSNGEPLLNSHNSQPIIMGPTSRQTTIIENQLYYLKIAINHLRNAYNGQDVDWTDQEEQYYGSGSGSGNGMEYEDGTGSGSNAFENIPSHFPEHTNPPPLVQVHTVYGNKSINVTLDENHRLGNEQRDKNSKENGTSEFKKISFHRTLVTYLLPICIAWFGGIISDLL